MPTEGCERSGDLLTVPFPAGLWTPVFPTTLFDLSLVPVTLRCTPLVPVEDLTVPFPSSSVRVRLELSTPVTEVPAFRGSAVIDSVLLLSLGSLVLDDFLTAVPVADDEYDEYPDLELR